MTRQALELLQKAPSLSDDEVRAALAGSLLDSLEVTVDEGVEKDWDRKIARRFERGYPRAYSWPARELSPTRKRVWNTKQLLSGTLSAAPPIASRFAIELDRGVGAIAEAAQRWPPAVGVRGSYSKHFRSR